MSDITPDLWVRLTQAPLSLDQTQEPLLLDREEVERYYLPLARLVLARRAPSRREIVAVAGPPGSGKSAFAASLTAVVNALDPAAPAVTVGLDGWHYPNAYLEMHTIGRNGQTLSLHAIKGAPETYDQEQIAAFLAAARAGAEVAFPVYSRERHDPVPAAGRLAAAQTVVVLEGNYWLLAEPPWQGYLSLFDLRIFLQARPADLLAGLRARHERGGKSAAFIAAHMQAVDLPNIRHVLEGSAPADVVVHKVDSRRIAGVEYPLA